MIKLKKPAREAEVKPELSLADRIRQTCAEAEALIESKVRELKNSPDAALLPIAWLDGDLRRRHGGNCSCRVALSILSEQNGD